MTMNRRAFAALLGTSLAMPRVLYAQPAKRVYRIAILDDAGEKSRADLWQSFRTRLRELGLVEGSGVVYDFRYARGEHDRLYVLAMELIASKPDIIVVPGTTSARAAMRATASIPIVFLAPGDPAGSGLVASLSRPGGNATGFSVTSPETSQKSLEILREISPGLQRVAYLSDVANPASMIVYARLEESARKMKISSQLLDGVGKTALERSFATIRRERIQGILVGSSGTLLDHRDEIVQFAAREKLPAVYGRREYVDAGGLVSYGIDRRPLWIRGAGLVRRILQGAKPADVPVEQVATVAAVLNMKTARALGIKIPESVRMRVDEVIE